MKKFGGSEEHNIEHSFVEQRKRFKELKRIIELNEERMGFDSTENSDNTILINHIPNSIETNSFGDNNDKTANSPSIKQSLQGSLKPNSKLGDSISKIYTADSKNCVKPNTSPKPQNIFRNSSIHDISEVFSFKEDPIKFPTNTGASFLTENSDNTINIDSSLMSKPLNTSASTYIPGLETFNTTSSFKTNELNSQTIVSQKIEDKDLTIDFDVAGLTEDIMIYNNEYLKKIINSFNRIFYNIHVIYSKIFYIRFNGFIKNNTYSRNLEDGSIFNVYCRFLTIVNVIKTIKEKTNEHNTDNSGEFDEELVRIINAENIFDFFYLILKNLRETVDGVIYLSRKQFYKCKPIIDMILNDLQDTTNFIRKLTTNYFVDVLKIVDDFEKEIGGFSFFYKNLLDTYKDDPTVKKTYDNVFKVHSSLYTLKYDDNGVVLSDKKRKKEKEVFELESIVFILEDAFNQIFEIRESLRAKFKSTYKKKEKIVNKENRKDAGKILEDNTELGALAHDGGQVDSLKVLDGIKACSVKPNHLIKNEVVAYPTVKNLTAANNQTAHDVDKAAQLIEPSISEPLECDTNTLNDSILTDVSIDLKDSDVSFSENYSSIKASQNTINENSLDIYTMTYEELTHICGVNNSELISHDKHYTPYHFKEMYDALKIKYIQFSELPQDVKKIGEASFSEVFICRDIVYKIIPLSNNTEETTLQDFIVESFIQKCLSKEKCICRLFGIYIVKGKYTDSYLKAWDDYGYVENERPSKYTDDQIYGVITMEHGGISLEEYNIKNLKEANFLVLYISGLICTLEFKYEFEHRDLHWGNILIKDNDVRFIDFTLSRLKLDKVVFTDLSQREYLFTADDTVDPQFGVYKMMRKASGSRWIGFYKINNLLWVEYLIKKIFGKLGTKSSLKKAQMYLDILKGCQSVKEFLDKIVMRKRKIK